jgi:hypothetical protein
MIPIVPFSHRKVNYWAGPKNTEIYLWELYPRVFLLLAESEGLVAMFSESCDFHNFLSPEGRQATGQSLKALRSTFRIASWCVFADKWV